MHALDKHRMISVSFGAPLLAGSLIQRSKRFFVDARLDDGRVVTAHTANTGAMTGLLDVGNRVLLTHEPKPTRTLDYSLQAIHARGAWVGVNTLLPNRLVERAICAGAILELDPDATIRREVPYDDGGRADLLVDDGAGPPVFVEVKSVTLKGANDRALFPDAPSERGLRHLHQLTRVVERGGRAALVLLVQRDDCVEVAPAAHVHPAYARAFVEAYEAGVRIIGLKARVTDEGVALDERIPIAFLPYERA